MLKQMIEGACSDCDLIGEEGINEFVPHLTELHSYCNSKKRESSKKKTSVNTSMIPMTLDKYVGSAK